MLIDPIKSCLLSSNDAKKLNDVEFEKYKGKCCLTGISRNEMELEVSPMWKHHLDTKTCEFIGYELICKKLAQLKYIDSEIIENSDIDLISSVNRL